MNCINFNDGNLSAQLTALGYFDLSEYGMQKFNDGLSRCVLDCNRPGNSSNLISRWCRKEDEKTCLFDDIPTKRLRKSGSCLSCVIEPKYPQAGIRELAKYHPYFDNKPDPECRLFKKRKVYRTFNCGERFPIDEYHLDNPCQGSICPENYLLYDDCRLLQSPTRCPLPPRMKSAPPKIVAKDRECKDCLYSDSRAYVGFDYLSNSLPLRTLKHDAVTRYFQYKKIWDKARREDEAAKRKLLWEVRGKMMHMDIPKTKSYQVPLEKKPPRRKKMQVYFRDDPCVLCDWKPCLRA